MDGSLVRKYCDFTSVKYHLVGTASAVLIPEKVGNVVAVAKK
jgi:hypothetical protein